VKTTRLLADFRQAAALLRDKNLVWSADLDTIREDLALYLESAVISGEYQNTALQRVVQALIADENDLSI
jgi:integral membrane sensor domain MASE1